jgi:Zn finger protein HypA/HybF involved in hydrogenase expression
MNQAVPIRRFPTRLHLKCRSCLHQAVLELFLSEVPRLRCSKCGSHNVAVLQRDQLNAWSRRRQGR